VQSGILKTLVLKSQDKSEQLDEKAAEMKASWKETQAELTAKIETVRDNLFLVREQGADASAKLKKSITAGIAELETMYEDAKDRFTSEEE
jgi:hypothetical protein